MDYDYQITCRFLKVFFLWTSPYWKRILKFVVLLLLKVLACSLLCLMLSRNEFVHWLLLLRTNLSNNTSIPFLILHKIFVRCFFVVLQIQFFMYSFILFLIFQNLDSYKPTILKQKWDIRNAKNKDTEYIELVKADLTSTWEVIQQAVLID